MKNDISKRGNDSAYIITLLLVSTLMEDEIVANRKELHSVIVLKDFKVQHIRQISKP